MEKIKKETLDKRNKKTVSKSAKNGTKGKNIAKVIIIVTLVVVAVIAILLTILKFSLDFCTKKRLNAIGESGIFETTSFLPKYCISKKNVETIKNKNILVCVKYRDDKVVILPENISKLNTVKVYKEKRKFNAIPELKEASTFYVGDTGFEEASVKLPTNLAKHGLLDVYLLNEDYTVEKYDKSYEVSESGSILIKKSEKKGIGYIVAYVDVKDVLVKNLTEGLIGVGKNEKANLDIEIVPSNATNKKISLVSDNEGIVSIDENNLLCGHEIGDAKITVTVGAVSKDINVHVSNPVKAIILNTGGLNLYVGSSFEITCSVQPEDAENKEIIFEIENPAVATIEGNIVKAQSVGSTTLVAKSAVYEISQSIPINVSEKINLGKPATNITYVNGILIANKTYRLPQSYNPGGLTKETMAAFNNMKAAAAKEGLTFWISSGFRSYNTQDRLYRNYVASYGQKSADTFSARPGHSEHQTGLAMDVNYIEDWFGDTKEGKWLAENCHKYGFIIRYPKSKEAITGYKYEPWHIRYLGVDIATDVYNSGLCLEEYLNITSKYDY